MDIRIESLNEINLDDALLLLRYYGNYMYDQLQLFAGKETFYKELNNCLLEKYNQICNEFLIGYIDDKPAGCIALKKWNETDCEMKRLYVAEEYRFKGLGKLLVTTIISRATALGYQRMLLDTNQEMEEAVRLYRQCGFVDIAPYCLNENQHVIYMQLDVEVKS
jgi:GNAT superfamily N-acetyltransferase